MTDTEPQPGRRIAVASIRLDLLGRALNLPDGYQVVAARPSEAWDGIDVLIQGEALGDVPLGCVPPRANLMITVQEGDSRPERVFSVSVAPW